MAEMIMTDREVAALNGPVLLLRPVRDRIVVLKDKPKEKTAAGLYLPDSAIRETKKEMSTGRVLAMGPGNIKAFATQIEVYYRPEQEMVCGVGDRIAYEGYGEMEVTIDGNTHIVIANENVLGVIEEGQ